MATGKAATQRRGSLLCKVRIAWALVCSLALSEAVFAAESPLVLFGAQSGRPTEADVIRTLETAKAAGYSDFMVYPRSGLEYEYMGEEWLALVGQYLRHAERLGMKIWLYDEFNFPSGSCKGAVTAANPDFTSTTCALYPKGDGSFDWRLFRASPISGNIFDTEAMALFVKLTHEVYEKRFRRYFGTVIKGIFCDEPGSQFGVKVDSGAVTQFRWYRGLERDYRAETGRDFRRDMEEYCRDRTKTGVWEDYTAVMGHAFRRAFVDPITAWCDKMGIVSTGHLMEEVSPYSAANCNGLILHVLDGFSFPAVDEIYTKTSPESAEWLTLATAQHAMGRNARGGAAELFALGPCDLSFDRMGQMIWLVSLHKVNTYILCLHHQTARGFVQKPHYSMFSSPLQPWFGCQEGFHDMARLASSFARKPFLCDVAVRYPQRKAGMQRYTRAVKDRDIALVDLLRALDSAQVTCDLYEEDECCDKPVVFDFEDGEIVESRSGGRMKSGDEALRFVRTRFPDAWHAERAEDGSPADALVVRRYADGSAAVLNLLECDRSLVFVRDGVRIPFHLPGRGFWTFRPVAERWNVSFDRPNRRRVRFLSGGTAEMTLERETEVRFATCVLTNAMASVTLDGRPLAGTKPCTFLGFGYDCDYAETERMRLAPGRHVFVCRGREDRGLFLPVLWMEGDFSVREPGMILPPVREAPCGPLASIGYADFSGMVTYTAEVSVPADATSLVLGTGRAYASVSLGGKDLGSRLLPPWEWSVPEDLRGRRLALSVKIATSARPMFGFDADETPGALPANRPKWVVTISPERDVGLVYAYWR